MEGVRVRFSVAMCTFNGEQHLEEQLQSFINQQRRPEELVVCDDGSTDRTLALLESFAASAPFPVHVVRNPQNLGYTRNFVKAIGLCSGDLVALADQDDIWYPAKLRKLEDVFLKEPEVDGIFSDGDIIDGHSEPTGATLWRSFLFGPSEEDRFRNGHAAEELLRRNVVTGMAFAMRRSAFNSIPDIPGSWMHDGWFAMMLAVRGKLHACPERLVGYRVHQTQQFGTPPTLRGKLLLLRSGGLRAYTQRVRERNLDEYRRTAAQFDDLLSILERTGREDNPLLMKVRAKAEYARRGARALARGRLQRLPLVLPHLAQYASLSPNGLRGALRDLLV